MGVLQRIALCYLAGGLLYLFTSRMGMPVTWTAIRIGRANIAAIAGGSMILLIGYWALLMTFVPVPYGVTELATSARTTILALTLTGRSWAAICGLNRRRGIPRDFFPLFRRSQLCFWEYSPGNGCVQNRPGGRKALGLARGRKSH